MKKKRWEKPELIKLKKKDGKVELHGKSYDLRDLLEMNAIKSEGKEKYFKHIRHNKKDL